MTRIHWLRWPFRAAVSLLLVFGAVLTMSYLQERFDRSDQRRALEAVQAKWPDAKNCRTEVLSRFQGQVRVDCEEKAFLVDVVRGLIEQEH